MEAGREGRRRHHWRGIRSAAISCLLYAEGRRDNSFGSTLDISSSCSISRLTSVFDKLSNRYHVCGCVRENVCACVDFFSHHSSICYLLGYLLRLYYAHYY